MKKNVALPFTIDSVATLHELVGLPKPEHPLISVVDMDDIGCYNIEEIQSPQYNVYSVCIKKDFKGKLKYGPQYYDFDSGTMTFFSPGQIVVAEPGDTGKVSGWWLAFHPDFIRNYPLGKAIRTYNYFSYATHEALHLSEKEEAQVTSLMQHMAAEYSSPIDSFSQDVIIAQIELLLTFCNRFYARQFITRKNASSDLLVRFEDLLSAYFEGDTAATSGVPSVQYFCDRLSVSPSYLSDMLKSLTGQTTQQRIHKALIDKAKEILASTTLSVSEIAYRLGFEYPQSFSKLFRNKTEMTPLEFRQSFN